jgi:arylsulfatase
LAADGRAYEGFGGSVGRTFSGSRPWWPPRPTAPSGAPNVVVVLVDDLGFSDLGCYGSEIATPALDAIAAGGVRYGNFHVAPLCSPTRAALLTGRNSHAAGMGLVANVDPGFPGYASELPANQPTLAETLRATGYSTLAVGKWHLCKDSDLHEAGDRNSWPLQRGFDQFYGILEALTNHHHPHRLLDGNSVVQTDEYPPDYYLTEDLTDRAVRMIREAHTANPSKPFFLYFAHAAVHAPLHAKKADIERHRGRYADGWDALRARRLARQVELGVMPPGTVLPPRNSEPGEDVVAWDSLGADEQRLFARYMEVYAAMVESIDASVARLRSAIEELGLWENTLFLFTSDNGASREGRNAGSPFYWRYAYGTGPGQSEVLPEDLEMIDDIGGPTSWPHYPRGWAMACNTPFRLYKVSSYRGGNQVPLIVSWPREIAADAEVRQQFVHVTDVFPTVLDLLGLEPLRAREGLPADELAGTTFAPTLADPSVASSHREQHLECAGHRAYYRDGWEAVTFRRPLTPFRDEQWQLFNVDEDPTQVNDLAGEHPERVAELVEAWDEAAWRNQVFPLDDGTRIHYLWRPPSDEVFSEPVAIPAGTPTLERNRSSALIRGRSFQVVVDWRYRTGDEGVLLAHGGQESGYLLYVEGGALRFTQNAHGAMLRLEPLELGAASEQVVLDVEAPGGGVWHVSLSADGGESVSGDGFVQHAHLLPWEGIDVGIDRRSPVDWELHGRRGSFAFTGKLVRVTYRPGALSPGAGQTAIDEALRIGTGLE